MNTVEARSAAVRRIVAEISERSFGGTLETTRFRDLDLNGRQEDEIGYRIKSELGVEVPSIEWAHFYNVSDLVKFVEMNVQRELPRD